MLGYINWCSYYSIGDKSIDDQHKQIIAIINDLWKAMDKDDNQKEVQSLLDRLVEYTHTHFKFEEEKMQACGYPELAEHKALHEMMRQKTLDFKQYENLNASELLKFLKQWWVNHILEYDKKYSPYLEHADIAANS